MSSCFDQLGTNSLSQEWIWQFYTAVWYLPCAEQAGSFPSWCVKPEGPAVCNLFQIGVKGCPSNTTFLVLHNRDSTGGQTRCSHVPYTWYNSVINSRYYEPNPQGRFQLQCLKESLLPPSRDINISPPSTTRVTFSWEPKPSFMPPK